MMRTILSLDKDFGRAYHCPPGDPRAVRPCWPLGGHPDKRENSRDREPPAVQRFRGSMRARTELTPRGRHARARVPRTERRKFDMKWTVRLMVLAALVGITAGCSKPPQAEMDAAKAKMEQARGAQADAYA